MMILEDTELVCLPLFWTLQPRLASNLRSSGSLSQSSEIADVHHHSVWLFLWFVFVFTLCVWMLYLHVCIYTSYISGAFGELKSVKSPGTRVTDSCVSTCGYRELTQSLCKGSVCPLPPSHLPGLIVCFSFSTLDRKVSMVTNSLLCWKQTFA